MIDVLIVEEQFTFATTVPVPSVMAVMNLTTLHRTAPNKIPPSGTPLPPRQISFEGLIYPHPKEQITLYLLLSQTWKTFQQVTVPTMFPT